MGLLHGLGREPEIPEVEELTVERGIVHRPERLERANRLVGLAATRVERGAENLQLLLPPADADAADEPST